MRILRLVPCMTAFAVAAVSAAPLRYDIDPNHTHPSFEADHLGGLSTWRGKINETSGRIELDREARTGAVDVTMSMKSIDFGHEELNEYARSPDMFEVEKFPTATYTGRFTKFDGNVPIEVTGELTLHGVTKPVTLKINQFLCKPVRNIETCGADALTTINRADFGVGFGTQMGFKPEVTLRIQVEAKRVEARG